MSFESLAETYLKSNAKGRQDGFLKADTHQKLSTLFVSEYFSISLKEAGELLYQGDERIWSMVRVSTLPLTDYLDEVIGFPLDMAPNYRLLTPKFVAEFKRLATEGLQSNVFIMTNSELDKLMEELCRNKFSMMLHALESYGFEFMSGDAVEGRLEMKSALGQVVQVTRNTFFGCKYKILTEGQSSGEDVGSDSEDEGSEPFTL